MPLEANLVYLDEELKRSRERLVSMKCFLKDHPAASVYKRVIRGNVYFYKKYWKEGKSISEFLCRSHREYQARIKDIEAVNKKRGRVKEQVRSIQVSIKALQRQLDIVRRAYESSRH